MTVILQLEKKTELITDTLKKFARQLKDVNPNIGDWLSEQTKKYNGLPCEVWPIRYSELSEEGYRNKCEFSIGKYNADCLLLLNFLI